MELNDTCIGKLVIVQWFNVSFLGHIRDYGSKGFMIEPEHYEKWMEQYLMTEDEMSEKHFGKRLLSVEKECVVA